MKPIQLRIASTLVFLAFAPVVGHGYVTYTWKGGDGNWSDPTMWTADDESTGYPNANDAKAVFPAGLTNTVIFTENIAVSNVVMNGEGTWMTFKCEETKYTLEIPSVVNDHGIYANGNECSFTMDNIKVKGGGGVYGAANSSYIYVPGKNGTFRMTNGAELDYVLGFFNAGNATIQLDEGTNFKVGSCRLNVPAKNESTIVIHNAYFFCGAIQNPNGKMRMVFRGSSPRFAPQRSVGSNMIYEFEIPAGPYTRVPIVPTHSSPYTMNNSGSVFKVSKNSPALRAGYSNTWQIIAWEGPANIGITTNNVEWTGLRKQDSYSFGWRTTGTKAQDPEVDDPAYMYLTLGPKPGMAIVFR